MDKRESTELCILAEVEHYWRSNGNKPEEIFVPLKKSSAVRVTNF
jgi:hypothetical protein